MSSNTPEQRARANIDRLLCQAGWTVQDMGALNVHAARGVAVREFLLLPGHGTADYLLYVKGRAAGVVEAKPEGHTLTGVESQSGKYGAGLPVNLPAYIRPLPFLYESTGVETRFTNGLDPQPRSRNVFSFHTPTTLAEWQRQVAEEQSTYSTPFTLRRRLTEMPPLDVSGLWPVQAEAIRNLEQSLAEARPRSLVQMATGSGKTFMACNQVYRLIRHAGARRVLFLVDRSNLGRQAYREFQGFTVPGDGRKFTELYNVQPLQSNSIDPVSRVCIATIQRVYSMLKGEELDPEQEEFSGFDVASARRSPQTVEYNRNFPIEEFDFIITDECHRSIYDLWRQVLEYFDAFLIGLTATPSKQTIGFFNQNLVMEYNHQQAVADGINVGYNVYRIETKITEEGSTIEAGMTVDAVHAAGRIGVGAAAGAGQPEALPGQRPQGRLRGPAGPHRGGAGPLRRPRLRACRYPAEAHPGRAPRPLGVAGEAAGQVQGTLRPGRLRPAGTTGRVVVERYRPVL